MVLLISTDELVCNEKTSSALADRTYQSSIRDASSTWQKPAKTGLIPRSPLNSNQSCEVSDCHQESIR